MRRWQRLVIRRGFRFRKQDPAIPNVGVTNMLGKFALFAQLEIDEDAKTLTLIQPMGGGKEPIRQVLHYSEPEENVMNLEGQLRLFADGKFGAKQVKAALGAITATISSYSRTAASTGSTRCHTTDSAHGPSRRRNSLRPLRGRTSGGYQ